MDQNDYLAALAIRHGRRKMQYGRVRRVQLNLPRGEHTVLIEVVDAEGGLLTHRS